MGQHVIYQDKPVHIGALLRNRNYIIIHPDFANAEPSHFRPTYPRVLGSEISTALKDLARRAPQRWGIGGSLRPIQNAIIEDEMYHNENIVEGKSPGAA